MKDSAFDIGFAHGDIFESRIQPIEEDVVFVYGGATFSDADAYLIVPGKGETEAQHQHGCVSCSFFEQKNCRVFSWNGILPKALNQLMGCHIEENSDEIKMLIDHRWPGALVTIQSEALVSVQTSWVTFYIATNNCD